jgi:hypothetical protein
MQPVDKCKARRRFLRLGRLIAVEFWLVCRVVLRAHKRQALAAVRTWRPLESGARAALLLRGGGGEVFQVAGAVRRSSAGEGHYLVEVRIPWEAALSLAAWAGEAVREGGKTALHSYVARINGAPLPPLRLVFDGYLTIRGAFIHKVLGVPAGFYYVELLLDGVSLLVPLKYYKYERQDRWAGGDSGVFNAPLDVLRTLYEWGFYDSGADAVQLRARVWAPAEAGRV